MTNSQGASERPDWNRYYDAMVGRPPRETLVDALDRFERETPAPGAPPRFAVDLGCGEGRDTVELLRRSWRVLAIDAEAEAIRRLLTRPDLPPDARDGRLETLVATFDRATWPDANLVNASYTLAFCPPEHFAGVWQRIVRAIRPGGRFAGQLFGDRDAWAALPDRTHFTRSETEALLSPFELESFEEEEEDRATALGVPKHWHVFHIVARKR